MVANGSPGLAVEYVLDADDLVAIRAARTNGRRLRQIGAFYFVFGALLVALCAIAVSIAPLAHDRLTFVLIGCSGAAQCIYGVMMMVSGGGFLGAQLRPKIGEQTGVAVDERGLRCRGGDAVERLLPWHRIARIMQDRASVRIAPRGEREIAIPARAFDDGGDAFYAAISDRIVSRRMLVRRSEASARHYRAPPTERSPLEAEARKSRRVRVRSTAAARVTDSSAALRSGGSHALNQRGDRPAMPARRREQNEVCQLVAELLGENVVLAAERRTERRLDARHGVRIRCDDRRRQNTVEAADHAAPHIGNR